TRTVRARLLFCCHGPLAHRALHSFPTRRSSDLIQMTQLIRQWGNNIRIISYDHRGHGDSGDASMHTYRIDRLADDLAEVCIDARSEEHTSELQSRSDPVCRLLLEKKKKHNNDTV